MQIKITDSRVKLEKLKPATKGSAGIDLIACIDKDLILGPNQCEAVDTGIKIFIEDRNIVGLLLPRSGLGHKNGIILGNGTGVMDSDYQGTYYLSVWNRTYDSFVIKPGDRVAQVVFVPVIHPNFEVVDEFKETERGEGGLGHTGKQ